MMEYLELFLFYTQLVYISFIVNGEEFNQSEAISECADHGGLQSNSLFIENNGFISLNSSQMASLELQNGESAWISGYAEYTKFMSWYGCYMFNLRVIRQPWNMSIIECFNICDTYKRYVISYIGFREGYCYCFNVSDIQHNLNIIPEKECIQQKPHNIVFGNTKSTRAISVYYLASISPIGLKQCTYAEHVPTTDTYGTASCYTRSDDIAGFICTNSASGKLNTSCKTFFKGDTNKPTFCLQSHNVNWLKASERCTHFSGKLTGNVVNTILPEMTTGKKYWTGVFRNFNIVQNASRALEVSTACLAVTRIDTKLVLDPDDCSSRKKYLCTDWTHQSVTAEKNPVTSNSTEKKSTVPEWLYIVVALALVAIVACIIFFVVRKFKKRSERHILRENTSSSFNNEYENPADANTASDEYVDSILRNSSRKIKPKKPMRQTLRKPNCNTSYENFKLRSEASGYSENCAKKVSEDYDKVDLKSGKLKLLDDQKQDENHIYDHTTVEEDSENYDTIKSTKSHKFDSVTYSTLQRRCEKASEKDIIFLDIDNKVNGNQFQDEAHDNNAYDAMGENRTAEIGDVLNSEVIAENTIYDSAN